MPNEVSRAEAQTRVHAALERLAPEYVRFLQEILRCPSHLGVERAAQARVATQMRRLGLAVDVFDCDPALMSETSVWAPTDWSYEDRPNVVGIWKGLGAGRSLILGGHIDTVAAGPPALWRHDPWGGEIDGNRIYGRGAADDKAGCAQMLLVAHAIQQAGLRLKGDLLLHSVVEDECTGNGTLACMLRGHGADAALVIDGTRAGRAIAGHSGGIWFRVTVPGRAAPAWRAADGIDPIEKAFALIDALRALVDAKLAAQDADQQRDMPYIFCIGSIQTGPGDPATVAGSCTFEGYLDFPPPETLETIKASIGGAIAATAAHDPWLSHHPPVVAYNGLHHNPVPATVTPEYTDALGRCHQEVFGTNLAFETIAAWCDLRHFSHFRPTPACLFGPGMGGGAHSPDEFFDLADLVPVARVVANFALDWCGYGE